MAKVYNVLGVTFREYVEVAPLGTVRSVSVNQGETKLQIQDDLERRQVIITHLDERLKDRAVRVPYENIGSIKVSVVETEDAPAKVVKK